MRPTTGNTATVGQRVRAAPSANFVSGYPKPAPPAPAGRFCAPRPLTPALPLSTCVPPPLRTRPPPTSAYAQAHDRHAARCLIRQHRLPQGGGVKDARIIDGRERGIPHSSPMFSSWACRASSSMACSLERSRSALNCIRSAKRIRRCLPVLWNGKAPSSNSLTKCGRETLSKSALCPAGDQARYPSAGLHRQIVGSRRGWEHGAR